MPESSRQELERLQSDAQWALDRGLGARDLVPMLERLRRRAPPGSEARAFASAGLAEVLVEREPYRAASHARLALAVAETDRCWALLGLALVQLGHFRAARRAFARALALAPGCASYAHNLGHLTDAALGRPRDALPYLAQAHRSAPGHEEIAASYAHALLRTGQPGRAEEVLGLAFSDRARARELLDRWAAGARA